ncbi:hypothetical protein CRG98_048306 [Punica granatum]|uniref:Reverse transcriptase domain-containing protein n=1 Tax=Punica granatum TaxID=22663 RepID=A0A2I0HI61_PUNGR|nr:hypothetical protein CRG98_048306 [Punica granatum]
MKAFDSVDWNFIITVLEVIGVPKQFLAWIRVCSTDAHCSICVNGSLEGYFKGQRGVRQGDPLSPYLVVVAIEVLMKLLQIRDFPITLSALE